MNCTWLVVDDVGLNAYVDVAPWKQLPKFAFDLVARATTKPQLMNDGCVIKSK